MTGTSEPSSRVEPAPSRRGSTIPVQWIGLFGFVVAGLVHSTGVASAFTYPLITSGAVIVAIIALRVHRPRVVWPWAMILVTGVLFTVANVVRQATDATGDLTNQRSLAADMFALPGYLLLGLAVHGLVRQHVGSRDIDALLDALLLSAGAGLLAHELLIAPTLGMEGAASTARWAIVAYPAISTCLLVVVTRVAFGARQKSSGLALVVIAMLALVVGDVVFALGEIGFLTVSEALLELPYLAVAAFLATASLNPAIHDPIPAAASSEVGFDRIAAIAFAVLAPVVIVATPRNDDLWVEFALCVVLALVAIARMVRSIDEQNRLREVLAEQATHDTLTGLASRSLIIDMIAQLLPDERQHVYVLFLDIDGFKLVNDSMGHSAGDELLVIVAKRLLRCVRTSDVVGRMSGDEFVIVATCADTRAAVSLGDRVRRSLAQPFLLDGGELFVSASIGIAVRNTGDGAEGHSVSGGGRPELDDSGRQRSSRLCLDRYVSDAHDLLQQADTAMYRSKERGKNTTTLFDGWMREQGQQRLDLERDLHNALELGQIDVVYQPIVLADRGRVEGFEALMRWSLDGRNISPAQFIPVAETCGLIVSLGSHVLYEACRQVAWWRKHIPGAENFYVSVNLSPKQVLSTNIIDLTKRALTDFDLPGEALWLEITETTLMQDTVTTSAVMQGLRTLGVRIAIDDFGTGFSSLSYLKKFPVTCVKIDRAFIQELGTNESDASIVAAIVAMTSALGLDTIAEGVETLEQADMLASLGCTRLQGYLFSAGVAPTEVIDAVMRLNGTTAPMIDAPRHCRRNASSSRTER